MDQPFARRFAKSLSLSVSALGETTVATIVLFLKLGPISSLAEAAATATAQFSSANFVGLRMSILVHAAGGLLVLLAATTLAVYKPSGMTWYGAREQRTPV